MSRLRSPGRGLDGKPGQLLQRLQNFAVGADQTARDAAFLGVHDRHGGAVTVNIHIDVTVHVGDVEELLEEVGRHLTLTLKGRWPLGCVRLDLTRRCSRTALSHVLARRDHF